MFTLQAGDIWLNPDAPSGRKWIAIALFFWVLLVVGWPMLQCHLRWSDSGMDYRYKMFQGCQISAKTGQWVPASTFRTN